MFEALIPCLSDLKLAVSDFVPQGAWVATNPEGVLIAGTFAVINIPKEADTIHLNIKDFETLKNELERKPSCQ